MKSQRRAGQLGTTKAAMEDMESGLMELVDCGVDLMRVGACLVGSGSWQLVPRCSC
jgi:hypothetical protein